MDIFINFANFPPIFQDTLVRQSNIGNLMNKYAEEERFLSQPRKRLITSFTLQNGTLVTHLLFFFLQLGLDSTKIQRFVEHTPKKNFTRFLQSAVEARTQGDENPNSTVVAVTMKFLANSSYGYQIVDRSRHTVTKYLTDKETHAANDSNLFERLYHVNNSFYEVEFGKAQIDYKKSTMVGFFILQNAKLRILQMYYDFFTKFCHMNKF